jgi:hypothetical protein
VGSRDRRPTSRAGASRHASLWLARNRGTCGTRRFDPDRCTQRPVPTTIHRRGRQLLLEVLNPLKSGGRLRHASDGGDALHRVSLQADGHLVLFNRAQRPPVLSATNDDCLAPQCGKIARTFGEHLMTIASRVYQTLFHSSCGKANRRVGLVPDSVFCTSLNAYRHR